MSFKQREKERKNRAAIYAVFCATLALLALAGCGGGSAPTIGTPGADIDTGNSVIGIDIHYSPTAITIVEGEQITSDGGAIEAERLQLDIPPDAVAPGETVEISVITDDSVGAGATLDNGSVADKVASFGNTYVVLAELNPGQGQYSFITGVDITMHYDINEIPYGFTQNDLTVFQYNGDSWRNIGGIIDPSEHTITISMNELAPIRLAVLKPGDVTLLSLEASPTTATLNEGETVDITVVGNYSNYSTVELTSMVLWESSNVSVAEVSDQGVITALSSGSATISAEYAASLATIQITVIDLTPPSQVVGLLATDTRLGGSIDLSWNAVADTDVVSYMVYYSTVTFNDTSQATLAATVTTATTSVTVTGLEDGTAYFFGVVAVDDTGSAGLLSTLFQITPVDLTPPNPVNPQATALAQTPGSVVLDWSDYAPPDDIANYWIYVETSDFDEVNTLSKAATVNAEVQTYTFEGLDSGTTYYFAVLAVDDNSNSQPSSVNTTSATPE